MNIDKAAILIKKASLEFDRLCNSYLEKFELTGAQYKVMKYLFEEADNGVRIVDLEKFYSMSHPTTIGIVQNLKKKGFIEYRTNPNNTRSRYIVPTKEAYAQQKELEAVGTDIEKEMTKNLQGDETKELIRLLKKVLDLNN